MRRLLLGALSALLFLGLAAAASAVVDWQVVQEFKTAATPIDVAVSADGRLTYVLSKNGNLTIYDAAGKVKDTVTVAAGTDHVMVTGKTGSLVLTNSATGQIQRVTVAFQAPIETAGSPYKGKEDAPVVLAVFSDFQ